MPRGKRRPRERRKSYTCGEPPCLHVVVDERKGIVKVFFDDGEILQPISASSLLNACRELNEALNELKLREAEGDEVDYLARKYLQATPIEDYEEEIVEEEPG